MTTLLITGHSGRCRPGNHLRRQLIRHYPTLRPRCATRHMLPSRSPFCFCSLLPLHFVLPLPQYSSRNLSAFQARERPA